jgi:2-polyprenyl-3-methyl-5-hydroxy-6-metoxy-1,4-benzoquinol methylase
VLDIACGTGNAALVADRAGALVTGLDASPRTHARRLIIATERVDPT